jgi:hypothetical protein
VAIERIRPEDKSRVWRPNRRVILDLDDVDAILIPLKKLHGDVRVWNDDFAGTIDSADELKTLVDNRVSKTLTRLVLSGGNPANRITVRLERPASVEISDADDLALRSALSDVRVVIGTRTTIGPRHLALYLMIAFLVISVWADPADGANFAGGFLSNIGHGLRQMYSGFSSSSVTLNMIGVAGICYVALIGYDRLTRRESKRLPPPCEIRLSRKADSFWQRKREDFIVNIVSGVLVGAVFLLASLLSR